jgi:hypothetical protein
VIENASTASAGICRAHGRNPPEPEHHATKYRQGSQSRRKTADISKAYLQQERYAKNWCGSLGVHAMSVSFEALVHHPDQILPQLAGFLGTTEKLPAMRACIDRALHRAQKTGTP